MDEHRPRSRRSRALRDALFILLPIGAALWVGASTDAFDSWYRWLHRHLAGAEDEFVLGLLFVVAGLLAFSLRRWSSERHDIARGAKLDRQYRALVEQMPLVVYTWDPRRKAGTYPTPYVSPQVERILGFTDQEWRTDPALWIRQIHPDDRDRVLAASSRADRTGEPFSLEYRHVKKDGTVVWIRDEADVVERDVQGRPTLAQGIMYDVTERRRTEEHLREAEARYRALVEHVPAVTYTWDASKVPGTVVAPYISPQIEYLLGFAHDEWQADPEVWQRQVHDDDRDRVLAEWDRAIQTGGAFRAEYRIAAKDGHHVWIRDEAVPVGGEDRGHRLYQGVMYDITDRKNAELQLVEAQERWRTLVEQMPAVVYIEDPSTGQQTYISPQVTSMFGFTQAEWTSDPELWERQIHPDDRDWVLAQNAAESDHWSVEYRTIHREGHVVWVHNESVLVRDQDGNPLFWQGVALDITERMLAEERVRQAEERYRTLVEQLPVVVYQDAVDETSTALYVSPQYERIFGFPPEARTSDPEFWIRRLHPDDRERVLEESRRTNETGEPFVVDYRFLAKDDRVVWVRDEAVLLRDAAGDPLYWQGVLLDITERKRVEEALTRRDAVLEGVGFAAERFLRAGEPDEVLPEVLARLGSASQVNRVYVFENGRDPDDALTLTLCAEWLSDGAVSVGDEGVGTSTRTDLFTRWEPELAAGHPIVRLVQDLPDERPALAREHVLSMVVVPVVVGDEWWGSLGLEDCVAERDWPAPEVEALKAAADTLGAAIGRARAERRQAETEQRYRTLVEQMPAVTYVHGPAPDDEVTYVSPQIHAMLGYDPSEWALSNDRWLETVHPDDRERVRAEDRRTDESGEPFDLEYRQVRRDGRVIWVRDSAVLVRDEEGRPLYWQGVRFETTAQKEAEEHLRRAEEQYRALVEHIPAVLYIDPPSEDEPPIYVGPQILDVMGVRPETYLRDPDVRYELVHLEDRERVREAFRRSLESHEPTSIEYRIVRPDDGRVLWIRDESAFLLDAEGQPQLIQGVMTDVTERKLAEQALLESERREREAAERLRALDEMKNTFLAAVSHELRSPLTSILGLAVTLEQTDMPQEDRTDLLGRLSANARKLDRLLEDLLDIDRLNRGIVTPNVRSIDVGELIRRTIENLDAVGQRSVQVETETVVASVDPAKVERIVENLVANAVRHTDDGTSIWVRSWAEDDGAVIAVEDDGPGVPPELQRAIFEPFRQGPTASPHSPGTGIGLSLVAMFAELHGGRAWVQDRDGGGSSFRVYLPSAPAPEPSGNGNGRVAQAFDSAGAG